MERYKRAMEVRTGGPYSRANVTFDFTRLKHPTWSQADDDDEKEDDDTFVDKYS